MEYNLIKILQSPKLMLNLQKKMNTTMSRRPDEVRDFLCQYLPDRILNYVNDHLILDISDMMMSLVNEDELAELRETQANNLTLKRKIKRVEGAELAQVKADYEAGVQKAEILKGNLTEVDHDLLIEDIKGLRQSVLRLIRTHNDNWAKIKHERALYMTRHDAYKSFKNITNSYIPNDEIRAILKQLNIENEYRQYKEGYNHEEMLVFQWWVDVIDEALAGRTHPMQDISEYMKQ